MQDEKLKRWSDEDDEFMALKDPESMAIELMIGKNRWLIRVRWIYTFFILLFFVTYNYISGDISIRHRILGLILGLSALGNIIFMLALKRGLKFPSEKKDHSLYTTMASLQLDFDLVVLSLLVFFSDGFESPVLVLFIFYIMEATFLIHHQKAIKNTITAMALVVVIYFTNEVLIFSPKKLATLIAFNVILFFTYFISAYLSKNLRQNEKKIRDLLQKTREMSVTDGLTNLYNQTHFFLLFRLQLSKSKRYQTPFSIIMFDVDYFKDYNDHNGHLMGSEVLRQIGGIMKRVFRSSDVLAKYGGDEFVIILPKSDKVGAFLAADRLREVVEEEPFEGRQHQPSGKITLSLGISSFPEHGDNVEILLDRADKALYCAKKTGRNKSVIYSEDLEEEE
ncbi:MAG: GGDEF domain-containing protein [Candidatus Aminicenantes bacterium]|nr:MAG: GGDEF domain-containing protein [Candidatus Aminicenantes bacterium]